MCKLRNSKKRKRMTKEKENLLKKRNPENPVFLRVPQIFQNLNGIEIIVKPRRKAVGIKHPKQKLLRRELAPSSGRLLLLNI
jgi:hypothetical protein